jgi:hypothetical protein
MIGLITTWLALVTRQLEHSAKIDEDIGLFLWPFGECDVPDETVMLPVTKMYHSPA